ncbi:MAG: hypothetical protein AB7L91_13720 [Dehalococcoidia bacterium]
MTSAPIETVDEFIDELLAATPREVPVLTASIDLGVTGEGRPVALHMLRQVIREAIDRYPSELSHEARASLDSDAEALAAAIEDSAGAAGLFFVSGSADGFERRIETSAPVRNAVDIDDLPALFELARYRYLAGAAIVLAEVSLRGVEVTRVQFGVTDITDTVEPHDRIEKAKQRTSREGFGAADGAGGHAMNRLQRSIEGKRTTFAADAAHRIEEVVGPGDLFVLAGVDSGRSGISRQLPDHLREAAIEVPAPDPGMDETTRNAWLTDLVIRSRLEAGDRVAARWFADEWSDRTSGGIAAARTLADAGNVETLILHEDAVDHFGDASDARDRSPDHNPRDVEALLRVALGQGAAVVFTRDPLAMERHQGVLAVARY